MKAENKIEYKERLIDIIQWALGEIEKIDSTPKESDCHSGEIIVRFNPIKNSSPKEEGNGHGSRIRTKAKRSKRESSSHDDQERHLPNDWH